MAASTYDLTFHPLPEWLRSSRPAAAPERSALAADKSAEDEHQDSSLSADGDDGRADGSDNNNNNGNSNSLEGSPERGVAEEKVQDECLNSHSGTRPSVSIQSMPSGADRRVVKHTVRFRGSRWKNLLNKKPGALEFAVKADISHACNIDTEFIRNFHAYYSYILVITFIVDHSKTESGAKQFHGHLRHCTFPRTVALYLRT
ncbi:unnamed protein product [Trypanosoma congolense IL3000]|uniref:WGS project CAEQ00000000 data, annotated contig 2167 n=1 Tax=Trypanosoma congolense (strain IL3000) TaxID=1068625 RepID=F9WC04_TRYCI|nr:unnamed protein product [Trypanosoma congolense IL3000]